jgi:hypothetical protein
MEGQNLEEFREVLEVDNFEYVSPSDVKEVEAEVGGDNGIGGDKGGEFAGPKYEVERPIKEDEHRNFDPEMLAEGGESAETAEGFGEENDKDEKGDVAIQQEQAGFGPRPRC